MAKEIGLGALLGTIIFLAFNQVDIWPLVLLLGIGVMLFSSGMMARLQTGMNRKVDATATPLVTFQDIGGQRAAKNELIEALDFVLRPRAIERLGIRPLKGILLTGPPGTGKTLLAKAAAQYTESVFLAASGSEFVEVYAGVGAQRVRQLFRDARSLAKREGRQSAIIFIDEIEVMAGRRGQHQSHLEYDQTLNQLLVEMDGMATHEDVRILVIAATNRADLLDPALMRPGRFDRLVRVDLPDREGREAILALHTQNKPMADDVDLAVLARETYGFSGAHLESVCNEAAILALREGNDRITMAHFKAAVDKVLLGEKLDRHLSREELRRVAVHEGGHAIIGELVNPGSVSSITISPRGMALGFVRQAPDDDRLLQTVSELQQDIKVLLAGSTAERILLGEQSTGAANDFEKAWEIARRMVLTGLSSLGVVHEEGLSPEVLYRAVQEIIDQAQADVTALVTAHQDAIWRLADELLEKETLPGEYVRQLVA
ncbi:Vesicle-fusing ATPase [Sulfobacillus acidophilus TPY]|uniref:Microtubule-severing ATPase n=1 Tax=Sulfobacillus acidophilus (strain ATCC 700253 / DSM 10332 / NAL) TaxID=679936 RepID=G8U0P9_SULAD|nr:Vesicle-fusing ATPase [Sulfobacillus acidophilus TPY]AEW05352.1 Microtubule-severing ATPase [Sulfobacillus acidophilus DSM 10332]